MEQFQQKKSNTKQKTIYEAIKAMKASDSMVHRIKLVDTIRTTLFKQTFPLPQYMRGIGWICLCLWTLMCIILSIVYGISFDLQYDTKPIDNFIEIGYNDTCTMEYNSKLQIVNELTPLYINNLQNKRDEDQFPGSTTNSQSFLMNISLSILLSMLLWQPLMIYITTWLKIWAFSYNFKLKNGPNNLFKLFKRCCGCDKKYKSYLNHEEFEIKNEGNESILNKQHRPLDVIGFFSNDQLFLKSEQEYNDNNQPKMRLLKTVAPNSEIQLMPTQINSIQVIAAKSVSIYDPNHKDTDFETMSNSIDQQSSDSEQP
eukprot:310122_1